MRKLFFYWYRLPLHSIHFHKVPTEHYLLLPMKKLVLMILSIYNKNRQVGEELDPKTLDEYLQLFINFKLKVEAESLGMDTVPSFVKNCRI